MMEELTTLLSTLGIVGGGGTLVGWLVLSSVKKRIADLEKIPNLEGRVDRLEQQAVSHNDTKDVVIRLEEQIKNLAEQVRSLSDLLLRKVIKYD